MKELCSYGCENEAIIQYKNGKYCCSESINKCPSMRKKNSDGINKNDIWNKGLKKETDERVNKYAISGRVTRRKQCADGEYIPWNKGLTKEDSRVYNNIKNFSKNTKGYYQTIKYFTDKYGEEEGQIKYRELNEKKKLNLTNFIRKYGEEGEKKYLEYINKKKPYYSKISQELFFCVDQGDSYFALKNKEFGLRDNNDYYFYDFVDIKRKKVIEFNGDDFHANPILYNENSIPLEFINKSAKEIWEKDEIKYKRIINEGYKLLIIWESNYRKNKKKVINDCINFLTH